MAADIWGPRDEVLDAIKLCMDAYSQRHPDASITLYRRNPVSVRIRVVDPEFSGMSKPDRHSRVWDHLAKLSEEFQSDISMLALISPDEVARSLSNLEFEDPSPSPIVSWSPQDRTDGTAIIEPGRGTAGPRP